MWFIYHCRHPNTLFSLKIKHSSLFIHFLACQLGITSIQGGKKINCLVKPEYNIIFPNEYTLDLHPSPLFYVDILDSKISTNNVFVGRRLPEKFHMINITSLIYSIGHGEVWSRMYFKIKDDKTFLHSPSNGLAFMLHPSI